MKPCKCCGKKIGPRGRNPSRPIVYCSAKCQNDWQNTKKIKDWKAGRYNGTRGAQLQLSQTIRNYILDQRGHKCNRCGWKKLNPTTGRVPVQVHHIDGNATNTKEKNLEVLCPNCHALTPNWGAGNLGKGRTTTARRLTSGKQ
jgi:5-methylcytosine-specific restriction endonuclease McrA